MPTPPILAKPNKGIHLPELGLWLDAPRSVAAAFISHAHSDHVARHALTICTPLTARLMAARGSRSRGELRCVEIGEAIEWQGHELRLLPAGHIVGSAMLHITRLSDGATLLYTGDFKLRAGLTAPLAELRAADTLIMETTFGLPRYVFPPAEQTRAAMLAFAQETLAAGRVPMLMGYSLGKAQEILAALAPAALPLLVHDSVHEMTAIAGAQASWVPEYRIYQDSEACIAGQVLVCPPHGSMAQALRQRPEVRAAMVTGWGLEKSARYRYRVDEVFPLSDHADYPELLETVELVNPQRVLTVHGWTREFAADLRRRGREAWSFEGVDQLELGL